jgi:hypothetical protein
MILTRTAGVVLAVLVGATVLAQTPDPKVEFEVASVRPSSKGMGDTAPVALGLRLNESQARIGALTLRDYIARKAPVELLIVDRLLRTPTDN